jgi:hypothetical protein
MLTKMVYFGFFMFTALLISCSKDSDPLPEPNPVFADFKPGSYWIYQQFIIDSSGYETATDKFDSCYVVKDT